VYSRNLLAALALGVALHAVPGLAADREPGARIEVRPGDLPKPYATRSVANPARIIGQPANAAPKVPPGFRVNVFASSLADARWLLVAPNGDVFLTEPSNGRVMLLRDKDGDGTADLVTTFAEGFDQPHGLALRPGYLYVADTERVWRLAYAPGQAKAEGRPEPVTAKGALDQGTGHWTRNIAFSPDGSRFYVTVGSRSNIGVEKPPRATIQEFSGDGKSLGTFASGLRNPVGIAFYPGTSDLYVAVNERDTLGDGLVPDYLTRLERGGFYGWPYSYIGSHPQPGFADKRPDLVEKAVVPDVLFESHSAPLGLAFYAGEQFPKDYRGDAFVALHGSWNAKNPRGYMVARVPFKDGRPQGYYETFMTGFRVGGDTKAEVWGRPVGLAVAGDGSLLVADDVGQKIWRISYRP
jgi:glucose/arabinose dehydrogenase